VGGGGGGGGVLGHDPSLEYTNFYALKTQLLV